MAVAAQSPQSSRRFDPLQELEELQHNFPIVSRQVREVDELPPYTRHDSLSSSYSWADAAPYLYSLRQQSSKIQLVLPFTAATSVTYKIKHQRGAALRSSRADFVVTKKTAISGDNEEAVAGIRFQRNGPLPWVPRATVRHGTADRSLHSQEMALRRMHPLEWFVDIEGVPYCWQLMLKPVSFQLVSLETTIPLARFTYSEWGTVARAGQEVGRFGICPPIGKELRPELLEEILCSAVVIMSFGKDLGKQMANRAIPEYEELPPMERSFMTP